MKTFLPTVACALGLSVPAYASPPMSPESVAGIAAALPECTGGWYVSGESGMRLISPADLLPRLKSLSRPSIELDDAAGEDLFDIAKALLAPATGGPVWPLESGPSLKCPARPKEAVALLQYLVGEGPDEWRGYVNAFKWLGLAYEKGVGDAPDPVKARRYYLRARMHSAIAPNDRWSDGVDKDLGANIKRAGLRPYLEALAASTRSGGAARMILAEEALPTNPARARTLLRTLDIASLSRLIELEESGAVPVISDAQDIAVWAEAWRTLLGYRKWATRMIKGVHLANGGTIPVAPERPSIERLRPHLDTERVAGTDATRDPVPVRALVNREGRAIYVEACRARPAAPDLPLDSLNVQLNVARLYNVTALPSLPIVKVGGHPAYGWVILPAVHFQRPAGGPLQISFVDLPFERCVHSSMIDTPPPHL
jgi:hypothetical protein